MQSIFGWYNTRQISPATQLSVLDVSDYIPENSVPSTIQEEDSIMYADEFGVLRYAENDINRNQYIHSPIINNSEVSVSDKVMHAPTGAVLTQQANNYTNRISDLGSRRFVHSYYVSAHFTIQTSLVSLFTGISDSVPIANPDTLSISVVDDDGNKYVDENNINKYEILLEKYSRVNENISNSNCFYRIIVLLEESNPKNLNLIYDKFETNNSGLVINQFLGYKEKINSVPYYEYVVEESEVVDFSSENKRVYSTQLFSHKENRILTHRIDQPGWKTIVPRKAIQDPRTFEAFNWRIAAKIVYDYSSLNNIYSTQEQPTINCAVLTTLDAPNPRYPYVFHNSENYPTNISNFIFQNPSTNLVDKSLKSYWTISLEDTNILNYNFDILYWAPTSPITDNQFRMINALIAKNTSVFIDCGYLLDHMTASQAGLGNFGIQYTITNDATNTLKLNPAYINGDTNFNAWSMSDFSETSSIINYGVFGLRKNPLTNVVNGIRCFVTSDSSEWSSVQNKALAYTSNNNTAVLKKYINLQNGTDTANKPCVYLSATQISNYINDVFQHTGLSAPIANNSDRNQNSFVNNNTSLVPSIEGPVKFFYNIVAESIKSKDISSRQVTLGQSSDIWFSTPWKNSWTINGTRTNGSVTVLTDQEKQLYNFSDKREISTDANSPSAVSKFCRQINSSLSNMLLSEFRKLSNINSSIINNDMSNVTFYIECTNDNVGFLNFANVSSTDYFYGDNISSYYVHKLSDAAKTQIVNSNGSSGVSVDAYSKVNSIEFNFSSINYPYMIVNESEYVSNPNQNTLIPRSYLGSTQQIKNYNFALKTQYAYRKVTEIGSDYLVNWQAPFTVPINGTGSVTYLPPPVNGLYPKLVSIKDLPSNDLAIDNRKSPFHGYLYPSKIYSRTDILAIDQDSVDNVYNNFHYTNDVHLSKRWDEYRLNYKTTGSSSTSSTTTTTTTNTKLTESSSDKLLDVDPLLAFTSMSALLSSDLMKKKVYKLLETRVVYTYSDLLKEYIAIFRNSYPEQFGDLSVDANYNSFLATTYNNVDVGGYNFDHKNGLYIILNMFINQYGKSVKIYANQKPVATTSTSTSTGTAKDLVQKDLDVASNLDGFVGSKLFGRLCYLKSDTKTVQEFGMFYIDFEKEFRNNANWEMFGDLSVDANFDTFLTTTYGGNDNPVEYGGLLYNSIAGFQLLKNALWAKYKDKMMIYPEGSSSGASSPSGSSSSSGTTVAAYIKNDYVKYIQYTLNKIGEELSIGKPISVDGTYGPSTKEKVLKFQVKRKHSFLDGIVDSETKSALAQYWIDLKRHYTDTYNAYVNDAKDAKIKQFIAAAVQFSDISAVGSSEYRRISFTGTKGPTTIKDYVIVKVPEECVELKEVLFKSGRWNTIIKNIYFYDKDLLVNSKHNVPGKSYSGIQSVFKKSVNVNLSPGATLVMQADGRRNIKFIMLELVGDAIGGALGPYSEGYSIADISFNMMVEQSKASPTTERGPVVGTGTGVIKGSTVISTGEFYQLVLNGGLRSLTAANSSTKSSIQQMYLEDIRVVSEDLVHLENKQYPHPTYYSGSTNKLYVYNNSTIQNMGTIDYTYDLNTNFSLSLNDTSSIQLSSSPSIVSVSKVGDSLASPSSSDFEIVAASGPTGNYIVSTKLAASFETETRSSEYIDVATLDYYLADADNDQTPLRKIPSTISSLDGVTLLTDAARNPIGFPNFGSITPTSANQKISFGFINLQWNHSTIPEYSYGLRWEFYNKQTRRFYGKKLSYLDYESEKNNIYIALLAYDADGDASTKNIIGGDSYDLSMAPLPNKIIAPLYSLKSVAKSKIGIYPPPADFTKFDSWFIGIGSGKFFKNITIPNSTYTNFLKNHKGKTLRCLYDTTLVSNNSSQFFGTGYYDVWEENPIIISENSFKVKHGVFHVYQDQLNKIGFEETYTDANPIKPWMKIEIKNTQTNTWETIDNSHIFSFDKNKGTVILKNSIVPSNSQNIRVSYVVKSSNIMLRHINGEEIPLNPFGHNTDSFEKPIFIYIVPQQIEYFTGTDYVVDTNYSTDSVINWTNDHNIFDPNKTEFNPLALHIGTVNVVNSYSFDNVLIKDLRVKGGGVSGTSSIEMLAKDNENVLSYADVFSGKGFIYPNGGYVIVRIPKEVKEYFTSEEALYAIVRSNLTAGISFDIQDLDGNDWRTI